MENKMEPTFYPLTGIQIGLNRETNSVTLEPRFLAFNKEHSGRAYSVPPEAVEQVIENLQEALKLLREDPPQRH